MTTVKFVDGADSVEFSFDKDKREIITLTYQGKVTNISGNFYIAWNLIYAKNALAKLASGSVEQFFIELHNCRWDFSVRWVTSNDPAVDMAFKLTNLGLDIGHSRSRTQTDPIVFWLNLQAEGKEMEDWGKTFRPWVNLVNAKFTITLDEMKKFVETILETYS